MSTGKALPGEIASLNRVLSFAGRISQQIDCVYAMSMLQTPLKALQDRSGAARGRQGVPRMGNLSTGGTAAASAGPTLSLPPPQSPKRKREERLLAAPETTSAKWALSFDNVQSIPAMKAYISKARKSTLASLLALLHWKSDEPVKDLRATLEFILRHEVSLEWIQLAFVEHMWADMVEEIEQLDDVTFHVSCMDASSNPLDHHPDFDILRGMPADMGLASEATFDQATWSLLPKLKSTAVSPEEGVMRFNLQQIQVAAKLPNQLQNDHGEINAGEGVLSDVQVRENIAAQQKQIEQMNNMLQSLLQRPGAREEARVVVSEAFDEVNRGVRLITPVPLSKDALDLHRSKELDVENLIILSAELDPVTGERYSTFDPDQAQASLRDNMFYRYKHIPAAVLKQMEARNYDPPADVFSEAPDLDDEEIRIAGGKESAKVKKDEQLKGGQERHLNNMKPLLRGLSLVGSNWNSVDTAITNLSKLKVATNTNYMTVNEDNAKIISDVVATLQGVTARIVEESEVLSDGFIRSAHANAKLQKQRDDVTLQINSNIGNASLGKSEPKKASAWNSSSVVRADLAGKTIKEAAKDLMNREINHKKLGSDGKQEKSAAWKAKQKEKRDNRKKKKKSEQTAQRAAAAAQGQPDTDDPEPEERKGKGKGKGKDKGNGRGQPAAPAKPPAQIVDQDE